MNLLRKLTLGKMLDGQSISTAYIDCNFNIYYRVKNIVISLYIKYNIINVL